MQTGYFSAAWHDIKSSPGWMGKLVVLALVSLIPIFGWIVVYGYLFGWARDIAWGVRSPMPASVFGNEDGKLYSRGFFAFVIALVCMLAPWVFEMVWGAITGFGTHWYGYGHGGFAVGFGLTSMVFGLLIMAVTVLATLFSWVGTMRMSIYGRLAPGLQFGKIWAMMRRDFNGLLRILGMSIVMALVLGIVLWLLMIVLVLAGLAIGFVMTGGNMNLAATHPGAGVWALASGIIGIVIVFSFVFGVISMVAATFVEAMIARALGYWTQQFDVPNWRGQDDPMPFELAGGSYGGQTPPPGQPRG